jgi:hypothetical protein
MELRNGILESFKEDMEEYREWYKEKILYMRVVWIFSLIGMAAIILISLFKYGGVSSSLRIFDICLLIFLAGNIGISIDLGNDLKNMGHILGIKQEKQLDDITAVLGDISETLNTISYYSREKRGE